MIVYLLGLVSVIVATSVERHSDVNYATKEKYEERIAGGSRTDEYDNDFQVQVVANGDQFCSGAIIKKDYILTAAHCVEHTQPDDVFVRIRSQILNEGGLILGIAEIVIHPEYDYPQNNNDVAYMRTTEPIEFDLLFRPAEFDNPETEFPDVITISGWGRQGNDADLSDFLRSVNLTVVHNLRCQVIYPEVSITKNMFCAENTRDGGQGACKGDGGGPATRKTSFGLDVLVGISSFTRGCGASMGPSVFTNLRAREIREFIFNGTRMNSSGDNSTGGNSTGGNSTGSNSTGGNSTGGNSTEGNSTGGNSTGGNSTGGNSTGGNSTGGNSTGGNSTGGNSTGGNSTGGNSSGGNSTEGNSTGGNSTGGNSTGGNSTGGNSTGGNSTGGNSTGGNSTGGNSTGANSTGGNSTGGNSTGGNSTGGNSTGGNSTGGNSTGGGSTGGNSTGGNSTGGNSTGGNSTGGNSSGGNSTGGNSTGGNSTGGNSTGGNSTGGNSTKGSKGTGRF